MKNSYTLSMTKIAISLPDDVASFLDQVVAEGRYPSRSRALTEAARILKKQERERLYEQALRTLNPLEEKAEVNAFGERETEWPKY